MATRALIIDDTKTYRVLIGGVLRQLGCEIVGEGEDGQQGVELFKQLAPDLVLLDIEMPKMSGIAALKAIIDANPKAQVVMCTTVGNVDVIDDCLMSGAVDFIRKDRLDEIPARLAPYLKK